VINDQVEILGGMPKDTFVEQALSSLNSQGSTLNVPES